MTHATIPGSTPAPTSAAPAPAPPRAALWMGRGISGFVGLFLLFDGGARVAGFGPYIEGTVVYGYPESYALWIGLALLVCTALYLVPPTAVLGAVLLTGYLGGAAASHLTIQDPWFPFPVVFGGLAWVGLYLREPRLRALLPLRRLLPPRAEGHPAAR